MRPLKVRKLQTWMWDEDPEVVMLRRLFVDGECLSCGAAYSTEVGFVRALKAIPHESACPVPLYMAAEEAAGFRDGLAEGG